MWARERNEMDIKQSSFQSCSGKKLRQVQRSRKKDVSVDCRPVVTVTTSPIGIRGPEDGPSQ